jgi:hypothetical protein
MVVGQAGERQVADSLSAYPSKTPYLYQGYRHTSLILSLHPKHRFLAVSHALSYLFSERSGQFPNRIRSRAQAALLLDEGPLFFVQVICGSR